MKAKILILVTLLSIGLLNEYTEQQEVTQQAITVKPEILKTYVGQYALRADRIIQVFLEEGVLYLQAPGETRKVKLLAKTETQFFNEINAAQIKFNLGEKDQVLSLTIINEVGRQLTAIKR